MKGQMPRTKFAKQRPWVKPTRKLTPQPAKKASKNGKSH